MFTIKSLKREIQRPGLRAEVGQITQPFAQCAFIYLSSRKEKT